MKRATFFLLSVLILICWLKPVTAQIQLQTIPQKQVHLTISDKIEEQIRNWKVAEDRYIADFLKLPPQRRIAEWKKRDKIGGLAASRKEDALIALGTDTVPFLIEIIHDKHSSHKLRALKILCDMDRFVRAEDTPLPEVAGTIYVKEFKLNGILNMFMLVDGRCIGKTGYDAIMWAAEQTKDKELRFHARHNSGLLEQDLRKLPLNEQFSMWKIAAAKSKGLTGDWDAAIQEFYLSQIIIEQAPETLPAIIDTLQHDSNGYVRERVLLNKIRWCVMLNAAILTTACLLYNVSTEAS